MKTLFIAYPEGQKDFADRLATMLQERQFRAHAVAWSDVPLELLVSCPNQAALIVCYGKRPEDTDVSTWHTCKINRVRVLPCQPSGTVGPAIYANIRAARFEDGQDWTKPFEALMKALA